MHLSFPRGADFNLLGDAWRNWLDPRTLSQVAALLAAKSE
jgi:hypothetical protein